MIPVKYVKYQPEAIGTLSNGEHQKSFLCSQVIIQVNSWMYQQRTTATRTYQKTACCHINQHLISIRPLIQHSIYIVMLAKIHVKQQIMSTLAFNWLSRKMDLNAGAAIHNLWSEFETRNMEFCKWRILYHFKFSQDRWFELQLWLYWYQYWMWLELQNEGIFNSIHSSNLSTKMDGRWW